jgi:hypothetical protein
MNPLLLKPLQAFAQHPDKPAYNNQIAIVKLMLQHKRVLLLFNDAESIPQLHSLLKNLKDKDSDNALRYHRELINLLALCAAENREVQILCSTLFTWEDIIEDHIIPDFPFFLRAPFYRLLTHVLYFFCVCLKVDSFL